MSFKEYEDHDATGLANLIRDKQVSALEVVETAVERIEDRNPELNAVIATLFDEALVQVKQGTPDGPLGGVPFLLKDLNTYCAGLPATNGCYAFKDFRPEHDSVLVSRYRAGGLVILGKTNTPELGLNVATEPALFGPTKNPHDHSRSPGGSSGGSAAAVASGMLPAAHATDSGGSIRIPASNCALFGLKPSRLRVPLGNDASEGMAGFSTVNAVSHSVRDSALLLDISAGSVPGDPYSTPPINGVLVDAVNQPLREKRVALWTPGYAGERIAPECEAAAKEAANKCEALGCHVEEACPDIRGQVLRDVFDVLFAGNIRALVTGVTASPANEPLFEPVTLACSEHGRRFGASDYAAAVQNIHQAARKLGEFFQRYDFLMTPTLANPPLPVGALDMQLGDWPVYLERLLDEIPFTPLFNATGCPAASLPLGTSSDGLPIGVQIGAPLGREDSILRLAAALESEWCWHQRER